MKTDFRRSKCVELPKNVVDLINYYAGRVGEEFDEALADLVRKGVRYHELEVMYDKDIHDREIWDRRYYYLKVEGGYLYYRLRLREVVDEMKSLVLTMSGLLSSLETCYRICLREGKESEFELKNIGNLRTLVKEYLDKYVTGVNQELEQNKYVSDEEVLESIEETVRKYRELFKLKSNNKGGERRTS